MKPEKERTAVEASTANGPQPLLRSAFYLLAGIGAATATLCLLGYKHTNRALRTGIKTLPVLLPVLLEYRHGRKPATTTPQPQPSTAYRIWAYILPTLLCLALGAFAGWLQHGSMIEWYPTLQKSTATPPNLLFPIAWGILYVLMGVSAGRILTAPSDHRGEVMTIWGFQLGFNFLWSILFFVARSPLLGMIDIVALDALVMLYIAHSYRIRRDAAWLFVPYLAWILYATYLNARILALNGPGI
ncbi:MAG: tryptophan-rich sensory protein [Alistipes sp.]|nr:tryptophan-rich sensory protein [Alistipes sp.]